MKRALKFSLILIIGVLFFVGVACEPLPQGEVFQLRMMDQVPQGWNHIEAQVVIVPGGDNATYMDKIEIGESLTQWPVSSPYIDFVLMHEWGHLEAIRRTGSEFDARPPPGFPTIPPTPGFPNVFPKWNDENWAQCVATAITGEDYILGFMQWIYADCTPEQITFTKNYFGIVK